jgi:glycolate oxidase iron-sulfur subunit
LGRLLRGYQRSGLQAIVRGSGLLRWLGLAAVEAQLPPIPKLKHYATVYPVQNEARGEVALFLGCIARILDQPTIDAAIRLLNKIGYSVHVPPEQNCCGAIHQHAGDIPGAQRLITQNLNAFAATGDMPVITLSSGCGAMLQEYGQHMGTQQSSDYAQRVYDLGAFLEDHHFALVEDSATSVDRVAVHEPCSLRNVMQSAHKTYSLLSRISTSKIDTLSSNAMCCGAAGIYFLTQPALSLQLRNDTLQAIQDSDCRTVVTSNIGCALHLAAGIASQHLDVEVVHPAILIDRVLRLEG